MPFSDDIDEGIINEIKEEYKKAAFWLPFSALEIKSVFSDNELEELSAFIKEVKDAREDNEKKAKAIETYSKISLKLLKLGKIIV